MQSAPSSVNIPGHDPLPTFNVVAIHDNGSAGIRAQEALERLEHSLGDDLQVASISWSFQNLERPDLRALSVRVAAEADVIIVAAQEAEPLPEQILHWLGISLQRQRAGRAVLVALHDAPMGDTCARGPLCAHLEFLANRWHTESMCNKDFDKRLDRDFALSFVRQKKPAPRLLGESARIDTYCAPHRGGINE